MLKKASLTLCLVALGATLAQEALADEKYKLTIPAQSVADAVKALSYQTEHSVLFRTDQLGNVQTQAITGNYSLEDALNALLMGTSLKGGLTESGVIVVSRINGVEALQGKEVQVINNTLKQTLLTGASAALLGTTASINAYAQNADQPVPTTVEQVDTKNANDKKKDEGITVTGTRLRRIKTSSPVVVLEAVEFEKTGATSVFELLSLLPEIGSTDIVTSVDFGLDPDSSVTNNNVPSTRGGSQRALGATNVSLRGLGSNSTLILINGRRTANFPAVQGSRTNRTDGARTLFNLDSIPVEAIERIEILKDGASTIYGSDAMAGVINIILKKSYNDQRSVTGSVKMTTEGDNAEYRLGYSQGFSNIGGGDNSILFTGEYVRQDSLTANQRTSGRSFERPSNASPTGTLSQTRFGPPPDFDRISFLRPAGEFDPVAFAACPAGNVRNDPEFPNDRACVVDNGDIVEITPKSDRIALNATYDQNFNGVNLFGNIGYSHYDISNTLSPQDVRLSRFAGRETLFAQLVDQGNRERATETETISLNGGLRGDLKKILNGNDLSWELSSRYSVSNADTTYKNYVLEAEFNQVRPAFGSDFFRATFPVGHPFFQVLPTSEYKVGNPGATAQDIIDKVRAPDIMRRSKGTSFGIDGHITGKLFDVGAGGVNFVLGGTYNKVSQSDNPDLNNENRVNGVLAGNVTQVGVAGVAYSASRQNGAIYGELLAPIVKDVLSIDMSGRYDIDDAFGSHFSPKIGFRFEPFANDKLSFSGTYTEGFRAPSIVEFGQPDFDEDDRIEFIFINPGDDPNAICADVRRNFGSAFECNLNRRRVENPNLTPETSSQYSFTLGAKPVENLELSAEYFHISRVTEIRFIGPSFNILDSDEAQLVRNAAGQLTGFNSFYGNISNSVSEGVNLSGRYHHEIGEFGTLSNTTRVSHTLARFFNRPRGGNGLELNTTAGFRGVPKWSATSTFNWLFGDWSTSVTYRVRGKFRDAGFLEDVALQTILRDARGPGRARICLTDEALHARGATLAPGDQNYTSCFVPKHDTFDLNIAYRGFDNLTLTLNVRDVFDEVAVFDLSTDGVGDFKGIGRTVMMRANYRF